MISGWAGLKERACRQKEIDLLLCSERTEDWRMEMKMKMKTAALLLALFAAVVAFAFAAPPVYPGAKAVDELNKAAKTAGQDTMTYNTADPFERVYEFYKSKGTDVERAHRTSPREKFAMVRFQDSGYAVSISWKEDSKDKGTIIHIGK